MARSRSEPAISAARARRRRGFLLLLGVLLFVSVMILSERYLRGLQLDLTEDGLYTLSESTATLLRDLEEPVTLDFYFSRTLAAPYPTLLEYGKRVEDMLRALEGVARGNLQLNIITPEPFSEAEDQAVEAGLSGVPLADGATLYLGLAARDAVDGRAAIPFFAAEREAYLEYDLVKMIAGLDARGKPRVGLLTTLPLAFGPGGPQALLQGQGRPYVIYQQMRELFELEPIEPRFETLPEAVDVLLLVHPPTLSDDQLFAIDQYALAGGRVLAFLDPHAEALAPDGGAPSPSQLGGLLTAWGVELLDGVVGDRKHAQRISTGTALGNAISSYLLWHAVPASAISDDDVVTGPIDTVNLASPGALRPLAGAGTTFSPLLETSDEVMLYAAQRATGFPNPEDIARDFKPSGERYSLLARLEGPAKTAYPERVAAAEDALAQGMIRVVVGSDADLFDDRFWVQVVSFLGQTVPQPIAGNGSLILGLIEQMAGSEALLSLRARGVTRRPFTVVDNLRRAAEARYLAEEQALTAELEAAEARLTALEAERGEGEALYSPAQEAEIERFRAQLLETRRALRAVKRNLRVEIDRLGSQLAALNIAAVPLLLLLIALLQLGWQRLRRRH